jgi:hypothetical protein
MADHGRDQELGVSDNETNKGPSQPPENQPTKKQLKKRKTGAEQILEEIVAKSSTSATPIPSKSISLYPFQTANTSNGSQDSQKGMSFKSLRYSAHPCQGRRSRQIQRAEMAGLLVRKVRALLFIFSWRRFAISMSYRVEKIMTT